VSSVDLYKFGNFVFRPQDYVLTRQGTPVSLTPKMFEVLLVLIRNRGRILGKDELMQAVWPDSIVEEGNLAVIIRQLRKALEDDAHNPSYIETVARRGYRFIAEVEIEVVNGDLFAAGSAQRAEIHRERLAPALSAAPSVHNSPHQSPAIVALADWRPDERSDAAREKSNTRPVRLELVPPTSRRRRLPLYIAGGAILAVVILAAVYAFRNQIFQPSSLASGIGVLSAEKLTDVGNVNVGSISPDGKMLAYGTTEAGKHIVWLRQLATGKSLQIIPPTDEAITSVSFSADGEHLNYVGRRQGESSYLNRIPILGGQPVRIISGLHGYDFSPDGRSVVFTRFGSDGSHVIVADSDGANERTVLSIPPPRYIISVSWSPGGDAIAFGLGKMHGRENDFAVMEFKLETGEQRSLSDFRWNVVEKVAWLPDRSGILLSGRDAAEANDQLWLLSLPDAQVRQITHDSSSLYLHNASADLTKIVASQSFLDTQIWISSGGPSSPPQPLIAAQLDVAMTPDGRVVFTAKDSVGDDIWIMNRDGTGRRQLTHDASIERSPVVAPDGSFIVFVSGRGKQNIWRMDLVNGSPVQLTNGSGEHYPTLTPDGRFVLFNSLDDGSLWRVPVEGGEPVKVLSERAVRVAVSPDGKMLAYFGKKENQRKLIVRAIADGSVLNEFDAAVWIASPPRVVWESSGRALIYQSGGMPNIGNLMRQPLDGSPPRQLTDFTSLQIYDFCVSQSGEFVFVRGAWKFDAVLLTWLK
jgi:Tol biopolymer transport system component/DNA-binding winged helix-turn-helix (wHTH) protein